MSASAAENREAPLRKYELGRPIIGREQRIALERIHHGVAQAWSGSMVEYLPDNATMEFEGLDLAPFSSVSIDADPCAQTMLFSIAATPISGFLTISGALAKLLLRKRLGLKSASDDEADAPFTRIETAIARETIRAMLARLGDAYANDGLGSIGNLRECDDLANSFLFAPEESLALLKFQVRAAGQESAGDPSARHPGLLVALSGNVFKAMSEHHPAAVAESSSREAIVNVVRRLPIDVDVVLGRWKVSIGELLQLRVGDKIVLPDGEDAWLAARGVRLRRATVEVSAAGARVEIRRSARTR